MNLSPFLDLRFFEKLDLCVLLSVAEATWFGFLLSFGSSLFMGDLLRCANLFSVTLHSTTAIIG